MPRSEDNKSTDPDQDPNKDNLGTGQADEPVEGQDNEPSPGQKDKTTLETPDEELPEEVLPTKKSLQADYTKKTQKLAQDRKAFEDEKLLATRVKPKPATEGEDSFLPENATKVDKAYHDRYKKSMDKYVDRRIAKETQSLKDNYLNGKKQDALKLVTKTLGGNVDVKAYDDAIETLLAENSNMTHKEAAKLAMSDELIKRVTPKQADETEPFVGGGNRGNRDKKTSQKDLSKLSAVELEKVLPKSPFRQ